MRSVTRRALTVGAIAATASAVLTGSGCEAKKQTEYVAGISTQVVVPRDLKAIVVNVSVGGALQFCRPYKVYDGKVQLPRSLGQLPLAGKPGPDPITVTVVGFTEEFTEASQNPSFNDCTFTIAKVNKNNARVLRRSRQPYVTDEVLFLPMPLKFSCFDKDCGDDEDKTCKAGRCESATTDQTLLPRFTPDLIDGTGGACFPASECFAAAVPAVVVDPNDCTYAIPNTASAPPLAQGAPPNPISSVGDGVNVEITYDGGYVREILDKDPVEGFFVPDNAKPQRFRLGPGLCDMVKGVDPQGATTPHRITAIRASGVCRAKGQFQPLCANDQLAAMGTPLGISQSPITKDLCKPLELKPAKSALMVLADDTDNHHIFFASGNEQAVLSISLSDPAFRQTDIGLTFFPARPDACTGTFDNKVPLTNALTARDKIFGAFKELSNEALLNATTGDEVAMGSAIADASLKLKNAYPNANRRALLVLGNRGFGGTDSTTCATTPVAATTTARANGVDTYVIMLARDDKRGDGGGTADAPLPATVPGADAVALAGSPAAAGLPAFDARASGSKGRAQDAFRRVVEDLATCAYDVDADPGNDAVLTYSDPVAIPGPQKAFYSILHDGACTSNTASGNGWGYNPATKRVHVCGSTAGTACFQYREILKKASDYAQLYGQPSLAVPLFSHTAPCAPK